jgi:NADH-quinone oxidoreductase subunit E
MTSPAAAPAPEAPAVEKREWTSKAQAEVDRLLTRYPTKRAALLMVLRIAEREFGSIDTATMRLVAETLDLTPAYVLGVFTFYTHYRRPTDGKYVIEICRTLPCALRGADSFAKLVSKELGLKPGETSKDGKFTLKDAECQAACDKAPVCQINALYHEELTIEKFREIVKALP